MKGGVFMGKANMKLTSGELLMLLAGILLCLVLISLHLTSGLYARYTTSASAYDSARVIRFNQLTVTEQGSFTSAGSGENTFVFAPGAPLEKDIKITFGGSEASTIIFVAINAPEWKLTDKIHFTDSQGLLSWSVDSGWTFLKSDQDTYVYYKELAPNETLDDVGFIKDDAIQVSAEGTLAIYAGYPITQFTVKGYAVQSNGFESVEAAWDSASR
jgi:hypothetical protein